MPVGRRKFLRGEFRLRTYLISISLVVVLLFLLYYFSDSIISIIQTSYQGVLSWSGKYHDVVNSVVSIILTGVLVYLYRQQQKILTLDHSPRLHVDDISPDQNLSVDNTKVSIKISNLGGGAASDLRVYVEAEFLNDEAPKIDNSIIPIREKGSELGVGGVGGYIESETLEKEFQVDSIYLIIGWWSSGPTYRYVLGSKHIPESLGSERIPESMPQNVRIRMSIQYENMRREEDREVFLDRVIPLYGDLYEIFEESVSYDEYKFAEKHPELDPPFTDQ